MKASLLISSTLVAVLSASAHASELTNINCATYLRGKVTSVVLQPGPQPDSHTHQPPAVGAEVQATNFYDLAVTKTTENCVESGGSANDVSYRMSTLNVSKLDFPQSAPDTGSVSRDVSMKISGDGKCAGRWKAFGFTIEFPSLGMKFNNNLVLTEGSPGAFEVRGPQYQDIGFRVPHDSASGKTITYIYPNNPGHYSPSWKISFKATDDMQILCEPLAR